jgi:glucosamine--fructose-6-phosphate aminotransferase (isomerizing)
VLFITISQSGASLTAAAAGAQGMPGRSCSRSSTRKTHARAPPITRFRCAPAPKPASPPQESHIASLAAIVHLVMSWTQDDDSRRYGKAPDQLGAGQLDWGAAISTCAGQQSHFVIGRGLGLGIAQEAALKLKESCGLHAEAFSAAEVRHGPMALVRKGFPILGFAQHDETLQGVEALATEFASIGADTLLAGSQVPGALELPTLRAHPAIEPLLMIQSFYRLANALAIARGLDPDRPPHLRKVTETI